MFFSRNIFVVLFACIFSAGVNGDLPCPVTPSCSAERDVVWASDGEFCYPFYNECTLTIENCSRQNRYAEVLKRKSMEECGVQCRKACSREYRPVCAIYDNGRRTFSTRCVLDAHTCRTGEPWLFVQDGECEE